MCVMRETAAPRYIPGFYTGAADLAAVSWDSQTEARDECFMAEEAGRSYTYGSGRGERTYVSVAFLPWVLDVASRLYVSGLGDRYNVCFLNRYEDERRHLGWHADDSDGMDQDHPIAVVSFGEAREIWWRPRGAAGAAVQRRLLEDRSAFVMPAGFQRTHEHRIPKGGRKMSERVSLTFRHFAPHRRGLVTVP